MIKKNDYQVFCQGIPKREKHEKEIEEKKGRCINLLTRGELRWWCRFADLQICKNYEKTSSLLKRSPDDNRKDFFRKDQGFVHSIRTSFFNYR